MPPQTLSSPLFRLLTPLLQSTPLTRITPNRTFTLTPTPLKKANPNAKKGDPRISLIRYHLQHPKTPRPLRFSRLRALRHWTIHRAWMLLRRKKREAEELELQRLYKSMHSAMEELRKLEGAGEEQAGRLYRIALEKKGIFGGEHSVPIEYARAQTDTPGRPGEVWNNGWKR
ncbi:Ribosomal L28 L40 mitochondrial protein [Rutstroemia sp. NJR-2017a BBW]|nr:Ribosomal L28 L40 mitochondrial protein [Rutstroemia sp. NJR-2017a BBW]